MLQHASALLTRKDPEEPSPTVKSRSRSGAEPPNQSDYQNGQPRSGRKNTTSGPLAFLSGITRRGTRRDEQTREQ